MTDRTRTSRTAQPRDIDEGIELIIARARRERAQTLRSMFGSLFGR